MDTLKVTLQEVALVDRGRPGGIVDGIDDPTASRIACVVAKRSAARCSRSTPPVDVAAAQMSRTASEASARGRGTGKADA